MTVEDVLDAIYAMPGMRKLMRDQPISVMIMTAWENYYLLTLHIVCTGAFAVSLTVNSRRSRYGQVGSFIQLLLRLRHRRRRC